MIRGYKCGYFPFFDTQCPDRDIVCCLYFKNDEPRVDLEKMSSIIGQKAEFKYSVGIINSSKNRIAGSLVGTRQTGQVRDDKSYFYGISNFCHCSVYSY